MYTTKARYLIESFLAMKLREAEYLAVVFREDYNDYKGENICRSLLRVCPKIRERSLSALDFVLEKQSHDSTQDHS
jgi:hypothetical protein